MRAVQDGIAIPDRTFEGFMDLCLVCRACEDVCPSHVPFGRMMEAGVGPHPLPQYEVHFRTRSLDVVTAAIEATGLTALVHPLTDDDLADHTIHARWIGEPVALDVTTLDPPGRNQGVPRFGKTDF